MTTTKALFFAHVLALLFLGQTGCAHPTNPGPSTAESAQLESILAPWHGEVRVSNFNTHGDESGNDLKQIAEMVVESVLKDVGVPIQVTCLELAGRGRRQIHAYMEIAFPEGGKPEERQVVTDLMAQLAPTEGAYVDGD